MSNNLSQYENVFHILHQDHSYFLASSDELIPKRKLVNDFSIPRIFHNRDKKVAALRIKNFLCSIRDRRIYEKIKSTLFKFASQNPIWLLRRLDYAYFTLFEKNNCALVFSFLSCNQN
ncbi:uncharacterized protein LOC123317874 isoform X2 [Coccinella septempunctata]|uniref:uncharacterized protein LOC123317874 isoform X2 n=1 Tax=Coccinella septempunctata TaxID=41139 RepID=UPI001D079727|nr:uncharacterized protein LOC123317874 isoform X2 [Coccinella septempunctata]